MNFFLASPRCSASTVFICRYFFLEELWELRSLEKEYSQDCILRLFTKLSASGFVCFFSPRGEGNKYVCVCVCVCVSKFCHSSMAYGNNNTQLKSTIYLYSFTHTHVQNVQILIFKEESIIHFRSSEEIFFSKVNFLFRLIQCLSVLLQWHAKDPGHSTKSADGRIHLNMHTPLTQRGWSGLSRHREGTY